ncbi:MAG: Fe-only nitrogenase accessory protein AnfO [Bacillota bacterium]|nr:Fe-only nitrogenase accessory protein AnfO [Bacillota bacterium]
MSLKIAVFLDEDGKITSVFKPSSVKIFEKTEDKWAISREFPVFLDMTKGIIDFREALSEFIDKIKDVKVVAASEISGIPYNEMDKKGFAVCETHEFSEAFLDMISESLSKEEEYDKPEAAEDISPLPTETEISGNYFFDLKKLLATKTSITSKQVLLPFLKNESFHMLEVVCSHVPPWFNVEFDKLCLKHEITKVNENEYIVRIFKKTCNE